MNRRPPEQTSLASEAEAVQDYLGTLLAGGGAPALECLVFTICGLRLALRLADQAGTITLPPMPFGPGGEPAGEVVVSGERVQVMDTRRLVGPAGAGAAGDPGWRPRQAVLLARGGVALACDQVVGTRLLPAAEICVRSPETSRPWLAGVAREAGVAILEPAGLDYPIL